MKTIHNTQEFLAVIGPDGWVTEPVQLAKDCWLGGLHSLRSLDGVALVEGCWLGGLTGLTSLEGVTLAAKCWLGGLTRLRSLKGATLADGCWMSGLTGLTSLEGLRLAERCELGGLTGLRSLEGLRLADGCELGGYLPWPLRFFRDRLYIGRETVLPGVTDDDVRDVIARHGAKEHTDRIFEVVNIWRGWIA